MEISLLASARKFIRHLITSPIKEDTTKAGRELLIITLIAVFLRFGKITMDTLEYSGIQLKIDFTQSTLLVILFLVICYLSFVYRFLLKGDHTDFEETLQEKFETYIAKLIDSQEEKKKTAELFMPNPDRPTPSEEDYRLAIAKVNTINEETEKALNYINANKKWVSVNFSIRYFIGFMPLIAAAGALVLICTFFLG